MSKIHVTTTINGEAAEFLAEPGQSMLDALRDTLRLTGSKEGCGTGDCGACSIMVDGRLMCSCLMLAPEAEGKSITTVEGIAQGDHLHPIQQKFLEHAALQCGFCTPGMMVQATHLLATQPHPDAAAVKRAIEGNLCRCTGYQKIVEAIVEAGQSLPAGESK